MTRLFIAGIMQGGVDSSNRAAIHSQSYRKIIGEVARQVDPHVEIVDPNEDDRRFDRNDAEKSEYFLRFVDEATRCDAVVAFVPTPSMGTAVELYAAFRAGVPTIVVSPLTQNWALNALADFLIAELDQLRPVLAKVLKSQVE